MTAWAPMAGGVLTGTYTRGFAEVPEDSKRAASNQRRLTERNLQIARELDRVADDLGFPHDLLRAPVEGQMVNGDLEPQIELPPTAPYRAARRSGT